MAEWQRGKVAANGINLAYTRTGGEKPPMLLAHGMTDNGLCWRRAAEIMQQYFDVIMLDARGHGESDAPETGYSAADHVADMVGVIEALELEEPVVMGHSMGATSLAILAAEHPDLISCAILEDPVWRIDEERDPQELEAMRLQRVQALEAQKKLEPYDILMRGRINNPGWAAEEFPDWVQAKQQVSPAVFQFMTEPRPDWRDLVARMQKPVLLIYGEPELGGIVTPVVAAEARRINPLIFPYQIAGAGHNIRREQFDEYMPAAQEFVAAVRQQRLPMRARDAFPA